MFSAATKTDGASSAAVYVEDVFATTLYTGGGIQNNINSPIPLGQFPMVYQANFTEAFNIVIPTKASDWVIVYIGRAAAAPTCTVNGSSVTASSTITDVNGYQYGIFLTQATSDTTTVSTSALNFSMVTVIRGPTSVSMGVNFTSVSGTAFATISYGGTFSSSGWAMLLLTDRDPAANPVINTDNGTFMRTNMGNTNGAIYGINGNGTSIPSRTVTGLDASTVTVFCMLNCTGSGTTVATAGPATNGGLVWIKSRSSSTYYHGLYDTVRGATLQLSSNLTTGNTTQSTGLFSFNTNGFSVGALADLNTSGGYFASWTFRKQEKFFDVVTYTGDGSNRTISHNLGSVPGCIIVKRTDTTGDWQVYHRSLANTEYLVLNSTAAKATGTTRWNSTTPTSTEFSLGTDSTVNANGGTYVAYLFAHDAGGFGAAGTDNVITCGTYLGSNHRSQEVVSLGYEPQWVMIKNVSSSANRWVMVDNMRGMANGGVNAWLAANSTAAETTSSSDRVVAASTGFFFSSNQSDINEAGSTFIYIAIRRGPMKVPTSGTSVFQPVVYTGTNVDNRLVDTGILTDMAMVRQRNSTTITGMVVGDRLRGDQYLVTGTTAGGNSDADSLMTPTTGYGNSFSAMNGFGVGNDTTSQLNASTVANNQVVEAFARAPGFFDIATYTGSGAIQTISHNLQAVPQMMWIKSQGATARNWVVYTSTFGPTGWLELNSQSSFQVSDTVFNNTAPTSSVFTVNTNADVNSAGVAHVAYLFGSVLGVSKVSYYVGKGAGNVNQVDCGFASGARLVMIRPLLKSTNLWYVYDSARGIVSGNDPYFALNSNTAENTSTDYVDAYSSGFELSTTAPEELNGSYADDWVQQAAVAGTTNIQDIMYANGYWVFGDSGNNIRYSTTGYSWTTVAGVLSSGTIYGVAFGNGLYVAVGTGGRISTSPDLTTWTTRTSGVVNQLNGAAYAFGKYWVVGASATVISSPDGVTWSSVSTGATTALSRVRLLNGKLVIIGNNGAMITSADGTNFTVQNTGSATDDYTDVTFGNSLYVAVSSSGVIRTSPDLVTWTSRSSGSLAGNNILGVTWTGNRFVAVATAGETGYSTDGITWSTGSSAGTNPLYCVAFGNDICIAGNGDGDIFVSDPRFMYIAIA